MTVHVDTVQTLSLTFAASGHAASILSMTSRGALCEVARCRGWESFCGSDVSADMKGGKE